MNEPKNVYVVMCRGPGAVNLKGEHCTIMVPNIVLKSEELAKNYVKNCNLYKSGKYKYYIEICQYFDD
jgi:hypothetical protein